MRAFSKERILEIPCGYVLVKDYLSSDMGKLFLWKIKRYRALYKTPSTDQFSASV